MKTILKRIDNISYEINEAENYIENAKGKILRLKKDIQKMTLSPEAYMYLDKCFFDDKYVSSLYILELKENVNMNNFSHKKERDLKKVAKYKNERKISKDDLFKNYLVNKEFIEYFENKYKNIDYFLTKIGTIIIKRNNKFIGIIMGLPLAKDFYKILTK